MRRALVLAALLLVTSTVNAQAPALYRWTDKDGKVQYSDRPPVRFDGVVTRIEIDVQPDPPSAAAARESGGPPAPDLAARRNATRIALAADVARARDRLEAAKAELAAYEEPLESERQVVQQRLDGARPAPGPGSQSTGGMLGLGGMHGGTERSNCRVDVAADGRKVMTCPTFVPTEAYYERVQKLEEAVLRAQAEVDVAEQAYRRGAD
jgi:hypothetical protein